MSKIYLYKKTFESMSEFLKDKIKEDGVDMVVLDESGWIKCSDELPETAQPVYVYDADCGTVTDDWFYPEEVGQEVEERSRQSDKVFSYKSNGFYDCASRNITHWMPITPVDFPNKPTE